MGDKERSGVSLLFLALGLVCAAGLGWLAWYGRGYYLLQSADRPLSPLHPLLRPSGTVGLACGVAGFSLIFLNLSYLARSSLMRLEWLGSLRSWMAMHVFTGLIGALCVLLHSAFRLRSPLAAIALISLAIVVVSGAAGRYIYVRVPRSGDGRELELEDLEKSVEAARAELSSRGVELPPRADSLPAARRGAAEALRTIFGSGAVERDGLAKLTAALEAAGAASPESLSLAGRLAREQLWLERYHELRELMRSWRFFHRWFSIVMLILASFHVLVAANLGGLGFSAR